MRGGPGQRHFPADGVGEEEEAALFHPRGPSLVALLRQGLSSTREGYDDLASRFEWTPFRTPDAVLAPLIEALRPSAPFGRAVDLCCGTGAGARALAPLCTEVVGVDFSRPMLDEAERAAAGLPFRTVHADVYRWEPDETFDLATCFGALGHINRRREFLARVHGLLRPGGRFVTIVPELPPWTRPVRWAASGFNRAMAVRNLLIKPPFEMDYFNWTVPECLDLFDEAGFAAMAMPLLRRGGTDLWWIDAERR